MPIVKTTIPLRGAHREELPNGFVRFKNISLARTGVHVYGPGEVDGIDPGPDGLLHIDRPEDEVFHPDAIASFEGQCFVNDHPDGDVTPDNFRHLIEGVILNPHRGTGDQKNELVGDVLVMSRAALADIDAGKRELSGGYDADWFQTGPGRGEQRNIRGNHVALVDAGRCGGRCALKDKQHSPHAVCGCKTKDQTPKGVKRYMPAKRKYWDRVMRLVHAKDVKGVLDAIQGEEAGEPAPVEERIDALEDVVEQMVTKLAEPAQNADPNGSDLESRIQQLQDTVTSLQERFKAQDDEAEARRRAEEGVTDDEMDELADEAPEGKEEEAKKAKDSAYLVESWTNVRSQAEIIAPGIRLPVFDRAADPRKTLKDCICDLRRRALEIAVNDSRTAPLVARVRGRAVDAAAVKAMDCRTMRTVFSAVATLKAQDNNHTAHDGAMHQAGAPAKTRAQQFADLAIQANRKK